MKLDNLTRLNISLSARKTFKFFFLMTLSIHFVNLIARFLYRSNLDSMPLYVLVKLFSVDGEGNIPAAYSSGLLLVCAALLFFIAFIKRQTQEPFYVHWFGLSLIFTALSWDEAVQIHEKLSQISITHQILDFLQLESTGILAFSWVVLAIIGLTAFITIYLRFFLNLPTLQKRLFLMSMFLYVGGALGMEMIGGYILQDNFSNAHKLTHIPYILSVALEEFLEMGGISLFIYSLLTYVRSLLKRMNLDIRQ